MESSSTAVSPPSGTSPQASAAKAELEGMLAQARNVKEMLENFKIACEGSTVSGHVVVRMAIGLQWLESMLRQNKQDIKNLQDKLEQK
jgi:hypothetical protein